MLLIFRWTSIQHIWFFSYMLSYLMYWSNEWYHLINVLEFLASKMCFYLILCVMNNLKLDHWYTIALMIVVFNWNHFETRLLNLRINFFIYCGIFLLILVGFFLFIYLFFLCCFFVHYVSAKFHLWPSSGDFYCDLG